MRDYITLQPLFVQVRTGDICPILKQLLNVLKKILNTFGNLNIWLQLVDCCFKEYIEDNIEQAKLGLEDNQDFLNPYHSVTAYINMQWTFVFVIFGQHNETYIVSIS